MDDTYDHDFKYVVTYYVPPDAKVELVGFNPKPYPVVTARYFYGIVHGNNPRHVQAMVLGRYALDTFAFSIEVKGRVPRLRASDRTRAASRGT